MVVLAVLGHEVERGAVEGARAHVAHARAKESTAQLVPRLAREGHRQDVVGGDLAVGHAALNAQRQDVRLARTRRRAHEVSSSGGHHRVALLGGEPDQEAVGECDLVAHDVLHAIGRW